MQGHEGKRDFTGFGAFFGSQDTVLTPPLYLGVKKGDTFYISFTLVLLGTSVLKSTNTLIDTPLPYDRNQSC